MPKSGKVPPLTQHRREKLQVTVVTFLIFKPIQNQKSHFSDPRIHIDFWNNFQPKMQAAAVRREVTD